MNKRFSLQKSVYDIYALSILMILTSLLIALTYLYNRPSGDLFVSVYMQQTLIEQHDLYENKIVVYRQADYPFLLGDVTIEIEQNRVRIEKETSPLNVCSRQGWVDTPGLPIICAPNFLMAVIEAGK
jgi:hypothetical protein